MKNLKLKIYFSALTALILFSSCLNPNDQPATENEITGGGETIISEITSEEPTATSEPTSATTESATTDTSAATEEPPTTEPPETEPPEPETMTSFSETAESQTTATITELTTVTTEEATAETEETTVTELEVEDDLYNMPEIVFVSIYWDSTKNAVLQCVTKDGRFKHYHFPKDDSESIYAFSRIENYDKIEEICVDTDIAPMSKNDLFKLYEMLLNIDEGSELVYTPSDDISGSIELFGRWATYGARFGGENELEFLPLGEHIGGDRLIIFSNSDSDSIELLEMLKETFPRPNNFY